MSEGHSIGKEGYLFNGVLLGGGQIPTLFGNTAGKGSGKRFYVNPTNGLAGNSGLTMDKPLATPAQAYAKTTSNNHDLVILSASSGHAASDELDLTNSRTHFMGLDAVGRYLGQRSRWTMGVTTGSAIAIVKNTGVGNSFVNIKFDSADTLSTSVYAFADGGEYTRVHGCEIVKSTDLDQTGSAHLLMNGDSSYYTGCAIGSLVYIKTVAAQAMLMTRVTISGKVCRDSVFEDCMFLLKTTSNTASAIHCTTATDVERMLMLKNCNLINAALSTGTQGHAIILDSAQTDGFIICQGTYQYNFTALATTASNVLVGDGVVAAAGTAGDYIEATS